MSKSPDAFRTISEVSEVLGTPAHVLRFWESKFSQIKPVKRAGGRRYYRPQDISLLAGIKHLLHEQGMTIKGAQKLLREKGVKHVAGLIDAPKAADAAVPEDVPAPQAAAPDPAADNVIGFNAMPPPTLAPDAAPLAKATGLTNDAPAPADEHVSAQDELPFDVDVTTGPRFFDAMIAADSDLLRARAAEIAPLMDRLREIKGRLETR